MEKLTPKVLLLGGGYTLSKLAHSMDFSDFVITSTTSEKVQSFNELGWQAYRLNIAERSEVDGLFRKFPSLEVVVDSIPPVASDTEDPASGAKVISDVARKYGVRRIVYLSTTGVFGVHDGSLVNEQTEAKPDNPRAMARYLNEQVYLNSGIQSVIFRIAAIYGPGRGIGTALKRGTYRLIQNYDRWSNRIHVEDLAAAIEIAIKCDSDRLSPVFCLSDGNPELTSKIVEFYCSQFKLPLPLQISLEEAKSSQMHSLLSNQRILSALIQEKLRIEWKYPSYRQGAATEFVTA